MEATKIYFEDPGRENTDEALHLAKQRADELGIRTIVIASTTGETAAKAMDVFRGYKVVVVSHSTGFVDTNSQELTEENRKTVEGQGGIVLTTALAFGGLNRAMNQASIPQARATYVIGDIVAATLRVFGNGMKVVCEIATMAADAGLVQTDEDVVAIAGTGAGKGGRGADTAVVIRPACAHLFFETEVKEIICKPRNPRRY